MEVQVADLLRSGLRNWYTSLPLYSVSKVITKFIQNQEGRDVDLEQEGMR